MLSLLYNSHKPQNEESCKSCKNHNPNPVCNLIELFVELGSEEVIDITEDIRAELLLNLPANLLCSEDCQGLCSICGINLNKHTCDCVHEEFDEAEAADKEPSPWDALDGLKFDK